MPFRPSADIRVGLVLRPRLPISLLAVARRRSSAAQEATFAVTAKPCGLSGGLLRQAIRHIPGMQVVLRVIIFLALAMAPTAGMAGSALPMGSMIHSGCDGHQSSHDDTSLRLCSMSVCHPSVAVEPEALICSKHHYAHDAGILPEEAGVLPELELPPPRSVI
jgi:hypothetical protein